MWGHTQGSRAAKTHPMPQVDEKVTPHLYLNVNMSGEHSSAAILAVNPDQSSETETTAQRFCLTTWRVILSRAEHKQLQKISRTQDAQDSC